MTLTKCAKGKPNSVRRGWFLSYVMVLTAAYEGKYNRWRQLYPALKGVRL